MMLAEAPRINNRIKLRLLLRAPNNNLFLMRSQDLRTMKKARMTKKFPALTTPQSMLTSLYLKM